MCVERTPRLASIDATMSDSKTEDATEAGSGIDSAGVSAAFALVGVLYYGWDYGWDHIGWKCRAAMLLFAVLTAYGSVASAPKTEEELEQERMAAEEAAEKERRAAYRRDHPMAHWVHKNCKLKTARCELVEDLLKKEGLDDPTTLMDLDPEDLDEVMEALDEAGFNLGERKKFKDALKGHKARSPSPGPR